MDRMQTKCRPTEEEPRIGSFRIAPLSSPLVWTTPGWIAQQEHTLAHVWHTKQGVFRRKVRVDVRDDPVRGQ